MESVQGRPVTDALTAKYIDSHTHTESICHLIRHLLGCTRRTGHLQVPYRSLVHCHPQFENCLSKFHLSLLITFIFINKLLSKYPKSTFNLADFQHNKCQGSIACIIHLKTHYLVAQTRSHSFSSHYKSSYINNINYSNKRVY